MNTYTHGHSEAVLRSHSARTIANSAAYLEPYLRTDLTLLDVGAGPGTISVEFAQRVQHVHVTEIGETELNLSRERAAAEKQHNMAFSVEDVHALSFPDNSFDIVHAHQVLQHVSDPVLAVKEMARVTKPGGIVAARDADYGAFTWWPETPQLTPWLDLYRRAARANDAEPDAGRRLLSWAHAAGLSDVTASSSTWCYATPDERAWWGGLWADRMTGTAVAQQLIAQGAATPEELAAIASGWREWSTAPDGWFSVLHGEILWRKPE